MNCLVVPLQAKLEDWRQAVVKLDKEHAKGKVYQKPNILFL
jgi:hypothetical protein